MRGGQWLYLAAPDAEQALYAVFDAQGRMQGQALRECPEKLALRADLPLTLLLPDSEVLLVQAEVPARQRQRARQAVPFALEEQLAEDVENLHFVLGERAADGRYAVAVLRHARFAAYLARLTGFAARPAQVLPASLALPLAADSWSVACVDGLALVRSGAQGGFGVECGALETFLDLALREAGENAPQALQVWAEESAVPAAALAAARRHGLRVEPHPHPQGAAAWMGQGLAEALRAASPHGLDLLQGAYRQTGKLAALWRAWRLPAALLLAWLGLLLALQFQEIRTLKARQQTLTQDVERLYREAFPNTRHLVNPRVQMERELQTLRAARAGPTADAGFLEVLGRMAGPLGQAGGLLVKRLDYREGRCDLELELPSLQAWENLKQALLAQDLEVDMQYSNSRADRVETRVRVRAKTP